MKNIVITPSILFDIIGVSNTGDNIFINKPSQLDRFAHKVMLNDEISAIVQPLNLNYLILKEMADVKNQKSRALPFGAPLNMFFDHIRVNFRNQHNQHIDGNFLIPQIMRKMKKKETKLIVGNLPWKWIVHNILKRFLLSLVHMVCKKSCLIGILLCRTLDV